jgi:hypothetical protein
MSKHLLTAIFTLLFTAAAYGQTSTLPCSSNCTLARSQPFSVAYNFAPTSLNPDLPDGFHLYQNGVLVSTLSYASLSNGSIVFPFASGLATSGTYTYNVGAYNSGGETLSDPIALTIIKGKPAKPTNGRVQ